MATIQDIHSAIASGFTTVVCYTSHVAYINFRVDCLSLGGGEHIEYM